MGPLLESLLDSEDRSAEALSGPDAKRAVSAVLAAARRGGLTALAAASPAGERLVGAAVYASAGGLSVWQAGRHDDVLVVDADTLSDLAVRQTIAHARLTSTSVAGLIVSTQPVSSDLAEVVVIGRRRLSA